MPPADLCADPAWFVEIHDLNESNALSVRQASYSRMEMRPKTQMLRLRRETAISQCARNQFPHRDGLARQSDKVPVRNRTEDRLDFAKNPGTIIQDVRIYVLAKAHYYRLYRFNSTGHVVGLQELDCSSEPEAIEQARKLANSQPQELWLFDKFVAVVQSQSAA
jgi:hypothetical protein